MGFRKEFRDEVALLPKLRHPNVVQFLGSVTLSKPLMLVTEYLTGVGGSGGWEGLGGDGRDECALMSRVSLHFCADCDVARLCVERA